MPSNIGIYIFSDQKIVNIFDNNKNLIGICTLLHVVKKCFPRYLFKQ